MTGPAFPSYDLPWAEQAFRRWMHELTGLDGPDLDDWIQERTRSMLDEVEASRSWNMRAQIDRLGVVHLTDRTRELLGLIAVGYSNEEAAKVMGIAEETVKHHMKNALMRTGCKNRTQLVIYAIATGQMRAPDDEGEA